MTVESFQKEIAELNKKKESLEKLLLQAQTERSVHLKTLQEEFGIAEDKIEAKLKEYEDTMTKLEEIIESKTKELRDYVEKLERVVNNG
jgi:predicted  nucleic acid-binding Zn-ribbon protein